MNKGDQAKNRKFIQEKKEIREAIRIYEKEKITGKLKELESLESLITDPEMNSG